MTATIIAFPGRAGVMPPMPVAAAPISAAALATKFVDHFLPVVQASVDLLEADQHDFEDRCRRMLDAEGTAMVDDLCAELQTVGEQMQILVGGLELTRARLRTAMARLGPTYPEIPGTC